MKRTPLRRGKGLRRPSRVKPFNRERHQRNHAKRFGAQAALCRALPCCACGARPCDPHHVPSVGAGGLDGDTVPMCRAHHEEFHAHGEATFCRVYGIDLRAEARALRWRVAASKST